MAKPTTTILPEKIKNKSHLLYKIQQKHPHWGVAKCVLLIGSGCSYPILPLGSGIIEICQKLCYLRDEFPFDATKLITQFLGDADLSSIESFIKSQGVKQFNDYIKNQDDKLLNILRLRKTEELMKVEPFVSGAVWEDFEAHILNDAKYGYWLDNYNSSPKERQILIEALIEAKKPNGAYIVLAMLLELEYFKNILTTNFDDFINDTLLYYTSVRPKLYADDELSQYISIYGKNPNIIKLHGDYKYANIKNTTKETLSLSKRMEDKLRELIDNFDIIVIGYNGADYSIMNVLREVKSENCELIWCGLEDKNVHWRVANLINNTSNSWFIKIKGFDDVVKDFYLKLINTPPDLIKKAKERQEELTKYLNEFNISLQKGATPMEIQELEDKSGFLKWFILASKKYEEKSYKEAIASLDKAIMLNDKNAGAYFNRGISYFQLKEYNNAIYDFSKAIDLGRNDSNTYNYRGLAYRELGAYNKAIVDYNKAIEINDKNDAAFNNRGALYIKLKEYSKAIDDLTYAIELNANIPSPHKHLGAAYFGLKKYDIALKEVSKAIELKEDYKEAYELRANIYDTLGKKDEAKKDRELAKIYKDD